MRIEINLLIFHTAPQPLNKYLISPGTLVIHADADADADTDTDTDTDADTDADTDVIVLEDIDKHIAGILATLIRVEHFEFASAVYRLLPGHRHKTIINTVREAPAQHFWLYPSMITVR